MRILLNEATEWDGGDGGMPTVVAPPVMHTEPVIESEATEKTDEPKILSRQPAPKPIQSAPPTAQESYPGKHPLMTQAEENMRTARKANEEEVSSPQAEVQADKYQKLTELLDSPLPTDYKSLSAEHYKYTYTNLLKVPKDLQKKLQARWKLVKEKLFSMQQMSPAPQLTANHQAESHRVHLNRPARRTARIEQLNAAQSAFGENERYFLDLPLTPTRPVDKTIKYLLTLPDVWLCIGKLREFSAKYEIVRLSTFGQTHPNERLEEIKSEFNSCHDPEHIKTLQMESALLSLPTSKAAARNMRIKLQETWKHVAEAEKLLLECALTDLQFAKEDSTEAEAIFFSSHPLKLEPEATSVSKIYDKTIEQIKKLLEVEAVQMIPQLSSPEPKQAEQTALYHLFGLGILADE
jgi:hypothetical protein